MLTVMESKSDKALIARSADEDLVRKIRAMDFISEGIAQESKVIEIPEVAEGEQIVASDIFNSVLTTPVRQLSVESW